MGESPRDGEADGRGAVGLRPRRPESLQGRHQTQGGVFPAAAFKCLGTSLGQAGTSPRSGDNPTWDEGLSVVRVGRLSFCLAEPSSWCRDRWPADREDRDFLKLGSLGFVIWEVSLLILSKKHMESDRSGKPT